MGIQTTKGRNRFFRRKNKENESQTIGRQDKNNFTLEGIKMTHYKGRDNDPETETLVIYRDDQIESTYINGVLQNLQEDQNEETAATKDVVVGETTSETKSRSKPKKGKKAKAALRREKRAQTKNTDPNKNPNKKMISGQKVIGFTEKTDLLITKDTDQETYKKYNIPIKEQYAAVLKARKQEWMEERREQNINAAAHDDDNDSDSKRTRDPVQEFRVDPSESVKTCAYGRVTAIFWSKCTGQIIKWSR